MKAWIVKYGIETYVHQIISGNWPSVEYMLTQLGNIISTTEVEALTNEELEAIERRAYMAGQTEITVYQVSPVEYGVKCLPFEEWKFKELQPPDSITK